ncbi:tigger transposable element-derived protein 1-like [Homarus americanus]|uniref:tigger transposable element-derived protein 1-like n=1 Tax=Homarus americanus TaxID=6706 RepID=UPI001C484212|nr:tigger transposable element-derived protein 1-like [Homarus americanus]
MESLLQGWIQDQTEQHLPLSTGIIMAKASNIWTKLKAESSGSEISSSFKASPGWFQWFKNCTNLYNLHLTGEAASADVVSANAFPALMKAMVEEGGYIAKQKPLKLFRGSLWSTSQSSGAPRKRPGSRRRCASYVVDYHSKHLKEDTDEQNITNKFLLILNNAPSHQPTMGEWTDNITVMLLSPNTTSLIQLMDQGIIATFKAYYST